MWPSEIVFYELANSGNVIPLTPQQEQFLLVFFVIGLLILLPTLWYLLRKDAATPA